MNRRRIRQRHLQPHHMGRATPATPLAPSAAHSLPVPPCWQALGVPSHPPPPHRIIHQIIDVHALRAWLDPISRRLDSGTVILPRSTRAVSLFFLHLQTLNYAIIVQLRAQQYVWLQENKIEEILSNMHYRPTTLVDNFEGNCVVNSMCFVIRWVWLGFALIGIYDSRSTTNNWTSITCVFWILLRQF